jgi:hypothetical protein
VRAPAEAIAAGLGRQSALWPMSDFGRSSDLRVADRRRSRPGDRRAGALGYAGISTRSRARRRFCRYQRTGCRPTSRTCSRPSKSLCENSRLRGRELWTATAHLRGAPRPDGRGIPTSTLVGAFRADRFAHPQRARSSTRSNAPRPPQYSRPRAVRPTPPIGSLRLSARRDGTACRPTVPAWPLERLRRFRPRRPRLRDAPRRRSHDAAAVDQRRRQPGLASTLPPRAHPSPGAATAATSS